MMEISRTTRRILVLLLVIPAFTAQQGCAAGAPVRKETDGATLTLPSGTMRLQVWGEGIIRVQYAPATTLADTQSLDVIAQPQPVAWTFGQTDADVSISTSRMRARVDRTSGAVSFFDANGNPLLREISGGGKEMQPVNLDGVSSYRIQQQFQLQPDEALYGLGQHQQGFMNYHGISVHLQQENREVAVPVLMSSKGYGILWDNPSITDVNCGGEPVQTIPSSNLIDADGKPGGLTGQYFSERNLSTLKFKRVDPRIDFDWSQAPPPGLNHDQYSVKWTGKIMSEDAGSYTFQTDSDDGVRLWVNGKRIIDDWTEHSETTDTASIELKAHSQYNIRLEYFQNVNDAIIRLAWGAPTAGSAGLLSWSSEAGQKIDYYFLAGPKLDQAISEYRQLTGKPPLFARWAWGYWQCKERYQEQQELLGVLETYRSLHIPIDNIIQDWFYWNPDPWGSHHFDPTRYPDPAAMVDTIHKDHAHIIISVWAKFADGSDNYKAMKAAGFLYPKTGDGSYYDAFNPAARKLYWQLMSDQIFSKGFDGWWLDASEPELGSKWGELRHVMTSMGPGALVFNAYPLMHTTGVYEGQRAQTNDRRVFILTRSAYAGQQRNAAVTWSGDIAATWDVFAKQISAGLNFSLSGIPYWNTDIGGFFSGDPASERYRELFVRWFQFGAFCPMFRVHGTNHPKEMWRFGPENMQILIAYDRLRYRLLPYIYSTAWMVTHDDYTLMRGLAMDFGDDAKVLNIADQFMFGPAIMVNPVIHEGATTRAVYLPAGSSWTNFWTGESNAGGQSIAAEAPLKTLPLFVRAGSILPMGPVMEYSTEKPADPIELRVYRGADGQFTLYEDENDNYNYEKGAFATIPMRWDESTKTLTIGDRQGEFPGMLRERTFEVVWVGPGHGIGGETTGKADQIVHYAGRAISVTAR